MWEEIVKDATGEMIEEVEARSNALKCSLEVAHYILKLEERLDRMDEYAGASYDRMIELVDHLQMVMQRHLEE